MSRDDLVYKRKAISAARDFHYGEDVIEMIKKSKSVNEISHITTNARKGILK